MKINHFPFQHQQYGSAIKEAHQILQSKNPKWSIGAWAKSLDLNTTASLTNILNGRRLPSLELHQKILSSIKLKSEQKQYIQLLFEKEKFKDNNNELKKITAKIESFLEQLEIEELDSPNFKLISSPLAYALIEASKIKKPLLTLKSIHHKKALESSLDELLKNALLIHDDKYKECFKSTKKHFDFKTENASELIRNFHEQSTLHALKSIRHTPKDERYFGSSLVAISKEDEEKLKVEIENFRKKIIVKYSSKTPEKVIQINFNLFTHFES